MNDYRELYELYHHGIKGQEWGVRRFQNPDGSLTPAGRARYRMSDKNFNETAKNLLTAVDRRDKDQKNMNGKESNKRWKQWYREEKTLSKKVFNDDRMRSKIDELHEMTKEMDDLKDNIVGTNSEAYKKAWNAYRKKYGDDDYGFNHYKWTKGNKQYDEAYKKYKEMSKKIGAEYDKKLKEAGETFCNGFIEDIDKKHGIWNRTYRQDAEGFIIRYSRFNYEDLGD